MHKKVVKACLGIIKLSVMHYFAFTQNLWLIDMTYTIFLLTAPVK